MLTEAFIVEVLGRFPSGIEDKCVSRGSEIGDANFRRAITQNEAPVCLRVGDVFVSEKVPNPVQNAGALYSQNADTAKEARDDVGVEYDEEQNDKLSA